MRQYVLWGRSYRLYVDTIRLYRHILLRHCLHFIFERNICSVLADHILNVRNRNDFGLYTNSDIIFQNVEKNEHENIY